MLPEVVSIALGLKIVYVLVIFTEKIKEKKHRELVDPDLQNTPRSVQVNNPKIINIQYNPVMYLFSD